jgi:sugar ABC transporter permease protein
MYDNKDKIKVIMYKVTSNGFFFRHSTLKIIITFQTIQNEEVLFMAKQKEVRVHTTWKNAFKRDWQLYLLVLIPLALVIIFNYAAYPGLRMVFMDYKPAKGYAGSKWVGWQTFHKIFKDADFLKSLKNSIVFNLLDLLVGFPMPIVLALMLNELRYPKFKKVTQTILYLPHFLSWVIVGSVAYQIFSPSTGTVNVILQNMGVISEGIPFLTEKWHWAVSYLLIGVWQSMGWGTIIYLAAITGISGDLYEAAMIDGAGRWKRMWYITLPGIKGTVVTLLIMNLGKVMNSNLERLKAFENSQVRDFEYQLAVYVYEKGLAGGNFSKATAVGLFQSLVGLVLVLLADKVAKMLGEDGLI